MTSAITQKWYSLGGASGFLGSAITTEKVCADGEGRYRHFQGGSIFWHFETGAWEVHGGIRDKWSAMGWERSSLGYPVTDETGTPDGRGRFNHFQAGSIYWTQQRGAFAIQNEIKAKWDAMGADRSPLGFPVSDESVIPGPRGLVQRFEGGSVVYAYPRGAFAVQGAIAQKWMACGAETGFLGLPLSDETGLPDGRGRYSQFEGGAIYWTQATSACEVHGAIAGKWQALGAQGGALGYPVSDETGCPDGRGRFNHFERGSIYWTPELGAFETTGAIRQKWLDLGAERSALGYPVTGEVVTATGRVQYFEHGAICSTGGGAVPVTGRMFTKWNQLDGAEGVLGLAVTGETACADGVGRYVHFEHGSIYWTATYGAFAVYGAIRDKWFALGAEAGLGYPRLDVTDGQDARGQFCRFERGYIYATPQRGAFVVQGGILQKYLGMKADASPLGYPTAEEQSTPDGRARYTTFEHGAIYWTQQQGAFEVHGAIYDKWAATGAHQGAVGLPLTDMRAGQVGWGRYNHFEHGSIYWLSSTGAYVISGRIRDKWNSMGMESSALGYPVSDEQPTADGRARFITFEHGRIYATDRFGARPVFGLYYDAYLQNGAHEGRLGYPASDEYRIGLYKEQAFEKGWIDLDPSTDWTTFLVQIRTDAPPEPPKVTVPSLLGLLLSQVEAIITAGGLTYGGYYQTIFSTPETRPDHLLVSYQDPEPGAQVPQGTKVYVTVASTEQAPVGVSKAAIINGSEDGATVEIFTYDLDADQPTWESQGELKDQRADLVNGTAKPLEISLETNHRYIISAVVAGSAGGGEADPFFQGRWVISLTGNADGAAHTWVIPNWTPVA